MSKELTRQEEMHEFWNWVLNTRTDHEHHVVSILIQDYLGQFTEDN